MRMSKTLYPYLFLTTALTTIFSSEDAYGFDSSSALKQSEIKASQQNINDPSIEELIVTAQKREQKITDVPVAITAFTGDFQRARNLDDIKDLVKYTPGFSGDSKDSFIDFLNLRGISTNDFGVGGDPSIGVFKNNSFQGRNGVAVTSLFDVERAEVVRGPQGFLFGRNAIGGAISLHTVKPEFDSISGYFNGGIGERDILELEAGINLPVTDNFAIRAAGYYSNEDGYVTNQADPSGDPLIGHEKVAGRVSATVKGDSWDFTIMLEAEDRQQDGSVYRAIIDDEFFPVINAALEGAFGDITPRGGPRDIDANTDLPIIDNGRVFSFSTELNLDLDFANLTSLFSYRDHEYQYGEDFDGTRIQLNHYGQDQTGSYLEGEVRLVSDDNSDSPLSWYAGVSAYHEDINAEFTQTANEEAMCLYYYFQSCTDAFAYYDLGSFTSSTAGLVERNRTFGDYAGFAAYGEISYALSRKLSISGGLRYSYDEKDFAIRILDVESDLGPFFSFGLTTDGPVRQKLDWQGLTPRFNIVYKESDRLTLYASATRGFKAGGFASFAVNAGPNGIDDDQVALPGVTPNSFDPESVWSFEGGIKGKAFDQRAIFDLIGYYYTYTDLQLSFFETGGNQVDNIGSVKGYGLEASAQFLITSHIDLLLTATWQNSDIRGADTICNMASCNGNRLPGQPSFITSGLLSHKYPLGSGDIVTAVEWRGQTKTFAGIDNISAFVNDGYFDANFRFGFEHENGWHITAYIENVFDAVYYDGSNLAEGILPGNLFGPSRPITFGIRFGARFGE